MRLLISNGEIDGRCTDVLIDGDRIAAVGPDLGGEPSDERWDAGGGAILPGLHDHHLHLHAMAAAARSVSCGPPEVVDLDGLAAALRPAAPDDPAGWVRGVGYHESVAGVLDRHDLDRLINSRPVRIQHRGGGLWLLNSEALRELGLLSRDPLPDGVEVDGSGEPTGRLWRADQLFRSATELPDLTSVGDRLLSFGITSVTDATPDLAGAVTGHLAAARSSGALPQSVLCLGAADDVETAGISVGPRKLLLHDHDLPSLDDLAASIASAHDRGRAVAVHCVTRASLVLTVTALDTVGSIDGDRIEHAAVVPADLRAALHRLRVRVVTQPVFIRDRGDDYLQTVDADDLPCLYPFASLLADGIPVTASSDAPFGDLDPWRSMAAAMSRETAAGVVLGGDECVTGRQALAGYLSQASSPGGAPRPIAVNEPAALCVLGMPLTEAMRQPEASNVAMVIAGDRKYVAH